MAYIGKQPAVTALTSSDITDDIITLAKMAGGTDGNVISYDSSGNPVAISTGTSGHFLKSAGAGAQPAFAASGISEADMWRINTAFTGNQSPVTANWERADTDNFAVLGTGLSQSSGVFTFPSTGYYYINAQGTFSRNGDDRMFGIAIELTENDSSYTNIASGLTFVQQTESDQTGTGCSCAAIVHCDDTSNVKIRFTVGGVGTYCACATDSQETGFSCFKLADT